MDKDDEVVAKILSALSNWILLKRELRWYQTQEPAEYQKLWAAVKKVVADGHS